MKKTAVEFAVELKEQIQYGASVSDIIQLLEENSKIETFEDAVKPLMKWLCENTHPHTKAIVTGNLAELVGGVENVHTNEFIVD
jgi:hypothetical protein